MQNKMEAIETDIQRETEEMGLGQFEYLVLSFLIGLCTTNVRKCVQVQSQH